MRFLNPTPSHCTEGKIHMFTGACLCAPASRSKCAPLNAPPGIRVIVLVWATLRVEGLVSVHAFKRTDIPHHELLQPMKLAKKNTQSWRLPARRLSRCPCELTSMQQPTEECLSFCFTVFWIFLTKESAARMCIALIFGTVFFR